MHDYTVNDGKTTYIRISKLKAKKIFLSGKRIVLCPVNLRPGYPFAPHCTLLPDKTQDHETLFNKFVNEFTHYNCINTETGYYPAFYTTDYKDTME